MNTSSAEPSFTKARELLWSRPERKPQKAKIGIIGGYANGFQSIQTAYQAVIAAGAGGVRVLLPDALRTSMPTHPDISFAASTSNGSFSKEALADMQMVSDWANLVFLPGDLSNNSETELALQSFISRSGVAIVARDHAAEIVATEPTDAHVTLVVDIRQLQSIAARRRCTQIVTTSQPLQAKKQNAQIIAKELGCLLILRTPENSIVTDGARTHVFEVCSMETAAAVCVLQAEFDTNVYDATVAAFLNLQEAK